MLSAKIIITGFIPIFFSIIRGVRISSSIKLAKIKTPKTIPKNHRNCCSFSIERTRQLIASGRRVTYCKYGTYDRIRMRVVIRIIPGISKRKKTKKYNNESNSTILVLNLKYRTKLWLKSTMTIPICDFTLEL